MFPAFKQTEVYYYALCNILHVLYRQLQLHNISFSSWSAATPQPAVTQDGECVEATIQEVAQDNISRHCESGVPFNSYSKTVILHRK